MPDAPHADCAWHVPPPPWQQTAGAAQPAVEVHEPDPPLEPELLPPELPPHRAGKIAHSPEPLLEPELDDPPLPTPDEDDELLAFEQTPDWHAAPVVVQSEHTAPPVPQVLSSWLVWHEPAPSQHPVGQLWDVQVLAGAPPLPLLFAASSPPLLPFAASLVAPPLLAAVDT